MKKISQWLSTEQINLNLTADSELEALLAILTVVEQCGHVSNMKQLAREILHHEVVAPSPEGCCSVVFRLLTDTVSAAGIYFGRFQKGIGYYARSGHPIDLIALVTAPPEMALEFHYVVKRLSEVLCEPDVTEHLREAKLTEDVMQIFSNSKINDD